jgi:ribulose-phosphate 3-epimerase
VSRVLLSPSILSADFATLADAAKQMEKAGADWLHIDVMDGHFVPNLTIGPVVVKSLKKHTSLPLDVHLMITDPLTYGEPFAKAGAWGLTFHVEAVKNPAAVIP